MCGWASLAIQAVAQRTCRQPNVEALAEHVQLPRVWVAGFKGCKSLRGTAEHTSACIASGYLQGQRLSEALLSMPLAVSPEM